MRFLALFLLVPGAAQAHASEQGFVLLLPTGAYSLAGALVVAATVLILAILPRTHGLFRTWRNPLRPPEGLARASRFAALGLLWALLAAGFWGPTDPLRNPLVLAMWTLFWTAVVAVQGTAFDLWRWLDPFRAAARIGTCFGLRSRWRLPSVGYMPALVLFLGFAGFLQADPAPADPRRLAAVLSLYLATTLALTWLFGPRWLVRGEAMTVFLRAIRSVAPAGGGRLGCPGWRLARGRAPGWTLALLFVACLGAGSFDGLNETYAWLDLLGINPLEYPGRSAVVRPNLLGLMGAVAALAAVYAGFVRAGLWLAGGGSFPVSFRAFAPSLLPIAAGYHVAHYLPGFLVDIQHVANLVLRALGLGERHVTTGFFNTLATVRVIWLAEAGAVVLGHVVAVLVAHELALRLHADRRRAVLSQAPLVLFMIGYTFFGLWLLAAPKGA